MVESPEPPHHHHAKTGLPWFDLIVPVAVLCISVASLLTSLQSEKSMHALVDQNKRLVEAQSTPLLMLDSSNTSDLGKPSLKFTLSNVGTGPAEVVWFHLVDGSGVSYTGGDLSERIAKLDSGASILSQQISDSLMRSGNDRTVFEWSKPKEGSPSLNAWEMLNKARFGFHASACYCSMFDECRITDFTDKKPKAVESCDKS